MPYGTPTDRSKSVVIIFIEWAYASVKTASKPGAISRRYKPLKSVTFCRKYLETAPRSARAMCQTELPQTVKVCCTYFYGTDLCSSEDCMQIGWTISKIQGFEKRHFLPYIYLEAALTRHALRARLNSHRWVKVCWTDFYWMGLCSSEDRIEIGCTVSKI